jgi:Acetyltransferase (GNAT) domain/Sterol carrier protein domain
VASVTANLIIRLLTPDLDWDQYLDLTVRSFGPADEARARANTGPVVADGRCLGAFEGHRMVGAALFHDMRQVCLPRTGRFPGLSLGARHEEIVVEQVAAASAGTTRALWRVVASHSSVADTVHAQLGPSDPLWWLLPEQDASIADRRSWMLRLLDAPAAIAARGFPATDLAVPLRITDDLRPANSGLWQLTVRDGTGCLSVFRTGQGDSPGTDASLPGPGSGRHLPLELGARGLAALYAGTPVAALRRVGLASGGSPAADAALDGAFAATPYMLDSF